jgi:hypothetical protein
MLDRHVPYQVGMMVQCTASSGEGRFQQIPVTGFHRLEDRVFTQYLKAADLMRNAKVNGFAEWGTYTGGSEATPVSWRRNGGRILADLKRPQSVGGGMGDVNRRIISDPSEVSAECRRQDASKGPHEDAADHMARLMTVVNTTFFGLAGSSLRLVPYPPPLPPSFCLVGGQHHFLCSGGKLSSPGTLPFPPFPPLFLPGRRSTPLSLLWREALFAWYPPPPPSFCLVSG